MNIASFQPALNINPAHRKDALHASYMAVTCGGKTVVECRIYWPASRAYACLWVNGGGVQASGSGLAGGGGYCKESAAASGAFESAGFEFVECFAGTGTRSIEKAVLAAASKVTAEPVFLIKTHA